MRNTCAMCGRDHEVTPGDDVLVPYCGCFGPVPDWPNLPAEASLRVPCESCGLAHAYRCPKLGGEADAKLPKGIVVFDGDCVTGPYPLRHQG